MFNNVEELKEFITWCRENGVRRMTTDDVEFVIDPPVPPQIDIPADNTTLSSALPTEAVDRDLLFYSARK